MTTTADPKLYARRMLQLDYFRMGMLHTSFVAPCDLQQLTPPSACDPSVRRVLSELLHLRASDPVVRVRVIGTVPSAPAGDLSAYADAGNGLAEWHILGRELMTWLCHARKRVDGRVAAIHRRGEPHCTTPGRADPVYDHIQLPSLATFLEASGRVAVREPADGQDRCPTIRRLAAANDRRCSRATAGDVWEAVGWTYARPDDGEVASIALRRLLVMCHVSEAVTRDLLYLACGRTPTPFWDRRTGRLHLHHLEVLNLEVGKCDGSLELLNRLEQAGWPTST